jgi:hypothetical protein
VGKSLDDYRRAFYGTTDEEYAQLRTAYDEGSTLTDLIVGGGGEGGGTSNLEVYIWDTDEYVLDAAVTKIYKDPTGEHDPVDPTNFWLRPAYECIVVSISSDGPDAVDITAGAAKKTIRMPFGMELDTLPKASCSTTSSSGIPTFDINASGATILSTKLTIDVGEKTSKTAAVPAVLSNTTLDEDEEITFDIDVAGTGCKGVNIYLIGYRL